MEKRISALGNALPLLLVVALLVLSSSFAYAQPAVSNGNNAGAAIAGGPALGRVFNSGAAGCSSFNTYRTMDIYGRDWCFDINNGHIWHWDNALKVMIDHSRNGCVGSITISGTTGNQKNNCIGTGTAFCSARDTTNGSNTCTVAYTDVATHQIDITGGTDGDVCRWTCP